jgi:hypothetical protein|nr:MAG TPA: S-layer associated multidomain endoglucanase binding module, Glycosidase, Hydrolase.4A [Bacteriophage sp.]
MWVLGDWGQSQPWLRTNGVKMTKGEDGVYTGVLTLPKGTKSEIQVMKSTVSTTSGGVNKWSATRYKSTLNMSAPYDFGEFTTNLIPNGNFDEGQVKWTPAEAIVENVNANSAPNLLQLGGTSGITSCSSDVFTIPPGQTLRLSGYANTIEAPVEGVVEIKIVSPQQQTLFEFSVKGSSKYIQFSKTFKSMDVPIECQITLSNDSGSERAFFNTLSLVSV